MEAVRHFLGFADDSDARVGRAACGRRLVMVGELPQSAAANQGLGFAKHAVARVEGTASGAGCFRCVAAEDECRRMRLLPG